MASLAWIPPEHEALRSHPNSADLSPAARSTHSNPRTFHQPHCSILQQLHTGVPAFRFNLNYDLPFNQRRRIQCRPFETTFINPIGETQNTDKMNYDTVRSSICKGIPVRSIRVPGGCGPQVSRQSAHEGQPLHRPPLPPHPPPNRYFWYSSFRG